MTLAKCKECGIYRSLLFPDNVCPICKSTRGKEVKIIGKNTEYDETHGVYLN